MAPILFLTQESGEIYSGSGSNDLYDPPNNNENDDDDIQSAHPLWWLCLPLSPLIIGGLVFLLLCLREFIYLIIESVNDKIEHVKKYLNNTEIIVNNKLSNKYIKKLNTKNKDCCIDTTCLICLDNINNDGVTLNCKHHFHKGCLQQWVKQQILDVNNPSCPTCRTVVIEMSDKEEYSSQSDTSDYD